MSFIVLVSWGEGVKIRNASDCITQEHGDEGSINRLRTCKHGNLEHWCGVVYRERLSMYVHSLRLHMWNFDGLHNTIEGILSATSLHDSVNVCL